MAYQNGRHHANLVKESQLQTHMEGDANLNIRYSNGRSICGLSDRTPIKGRIRAILEGRFESKYPQTVWIYMGFDSIE
jgi:hypothetical protein